MDNAAIAKELVKRQLEFVEWLKENSMYNPMESAETMQKMHEVWKAPSCGFQLRVEPWMDACFGPEISTDTQERNHRFLEEALELVQACDCTASEAHQLVDYVYGRSVGDKPQEVGGVMVTLAALCLAQQMDMHDAGEVELARIWTKVDQIRAKQAAKPKHSPLPQSAHNHAMLCPHSQGLTDYCEPCGRVNGGGS
jgi:hypothetical protein